MGTRLSPSRDSPGYKCPALNICTCVHIGGNTGKNNITSVGVMRKADWPAIALLNVSKGWIMQGKTTLGMARAWPWATSPKWNNFGWKKKTKTTHWPSSALQSRCRLPPWYGCVYDLWCRNPTKSVLLWSGCRKSSSAKMARRWHQMISKYALFYVFASWILPSIHEQVRIWLVGLNSNFLFLSSYLISFFLSDL